MVLSPREGGSFKEDRCTKAICRNSTKENKRKYKSMKKKAVSKAMREKAEEALTEL